MRKRRDRKNAQWKEVRGRAREGERGERGELRRRKKISSSPLRARGERRKRILLLLSFMH